VNLRDNKQATTRLNPILTREALSRGHALIRPSVNIAYWTNPVNSYPLAQDPLKIATNLAPSTDARHLRSRSPWFPNFLWDPARFDTKALLRSGGSLDDIEIKPRS